MRVLAMTLVLSCFCRSPVAHAQRASRGLDAALRPAPVVSLPTRTPAATAVTRRTRALEGAVLGLTVGAAVTVILTRIGGSTAPCDRAANQDALSPRECVGLAVAGGLAGAGVGALVGSRIRVSALQELPPRHSGLGRRGTQVVIAAVSVVIPPN